MLCEQNLLWPDMLVGTSSDGDINMSPFSRDWHNESNMHHIAGRFHSATGKTLFVVHQDRDEDEDDEDDMLSVISDPILQLKSVTQGLYSESQRRNKRDKMLAVTTTLNSISLTSSRINTMMGETKESEGSDYDEDAGDIPMNRPTRAALLRQNSSPRRQLKSSTSSTASSIYEYIIESILNQMNDITDSSMAFKTMDVENFGHSPSAAIQKQTSSSVRVLRTIALSSSSDHQNQKQQHQQLTLVSQAPLQKHPSQHKPVAATVCDLIRRECSEETREIMELLQKSIINDEIKRREGIMEQEPQRRPNNSKSGSSSSLPLPRKLSQQQQQLTSSSTATSKSTSTTRTMAATVPFNWRKSVEIGSSSSQQYPASPKTRTTERSWSLSSFGKMTMFAMANRSSHSVSTCQPHSSSKLMTFNKSIHVPQSVGNNNIGENVVVSFSSPRTSHLVEI